MEKMLLIALALIALLTIIYCGWLLRELSDENKSSHGRDATEANFLPVKS
jgi:hypothetical protein